MIKRLALLAGLTAVTVAAPAFAASGGDLVDPLTFRIAIFVLAIFVGYYVVWSVTPALHTPLMAVTNAISSVIIVGALVAAAANLPAGAADDSPVILQTWIAKGLGGLAVALAAVNIFGGFLVTQRMLAMYKKKDKPAPKPETT